MLRLCYGRVGHVDGRVSITDVSVFSQVFFRRALPVLFEIAPRHPLSRPSCCLNRLRAQLVKLLPALLTIAPRRLCSLLHYYPRFHYGYYGRVGRFD